ncbi:hypothetical protein [Intestinibacter bartlettii]|uniref:hypothetical protein n=1 Tax=Intestinibacter bartlettii TaxID=261299 RepID=UPI00242F6E33|nr:hypothetical protein [Intestinibacter bartlettii]
MKISGSINHYLRYYDKRMSDEELLEDYVEYVLGGENGSYEYLDKKTFEYIEVSDEIVERAINAFKERLKKKREKEKINEIGENFSRNKEIKNELFLIFVSFISFSN